MSTPGLGLHKRFDEYTDFATFVLADGSTEAIASALGKPCCRIRDGQPVAPHDPQSHLGLVVEVPGQVWKTIDLEEDHDGIPIASEIDDDKFCIPFEDWFAEQFDAARAFREPIAPLRRSTALATAVKVSREAGCRAIAIWIYELGPGGIAFLNRGTIERVILADFNPAVELLPGREPVPVEGYFTAITERVLIEEGVALPYIPLPTDEQALSEFQEVWSVQLRAEDLDLSRWKSVAKNYG